MKMKEFLTYDQVILKAPVTTRSSKLSCNELAEYLNKELLRNSMYSQQTETYVPN